MLITVDWRSELITRIKCYYDFKQSMDDFKAELDLVKQRDPMTKTRGYDDCKHGGNSGKDDTHIAIRLSDRENKLKCRLAEYQGIINEIDSGMRLLTDVERKVIENRFIENKSIEQTADDLRLSISYIKKLTKSALNKLDSQMIKY